jgi:hypothetical protein
MHTQRGIEHFLEMAKVELVAKTLREEEQRYNHRMGTHLRQTRRELILCNTHRVPSECLGRMDLFVLDLHPIHTEEGAVVEQ